METAIQTTEKKDLAVLGSWKELLDRAEYFAKSQLVPASLRGKPHDIAIVLQIGFELDIPPMQSLNSIDVIQGKPAISPQLMIALIRSKVPSAVIEFRETTDSKAVVFMARSREQASEGYTATWDDAKARPMGLLDKDNYKKQKGTMYRWRAVSEAARMIFPDVIKGLYLDIEVRDMPSTEDKASKVQAKVMGEPAIETTATKVEELPAIVEPGTFDAETAPVELPEAVAENPDAEPAITHAPLCEACGTELVKSKTKPVLYCPNFQDKSKGQHSRVNV